MSKTWIFDEYTGTVITGSFHPKGGMTAHQRLAKACGFRNVENLIGGSIRADGSIGFRSESLNNLSIGQCDASERYSRQVTDALQNQSLTRMQWVYFTDGNSG